MQDAREIKSMIVMAKAAFNRKKTFHQQIRLKCKEVTSKVHIWIIGLYGAETWTLRKVGQKYLDSFEVWCWRRM
jgi:hypothetical protein